MWQTVQSLDELTEDVRINGFQSPVTLAVDPVSYTCNLHDGNHRMTSATEFNVDSSQSSNTLGLTNNYRKSLRFLNLFLIYGAYVNLDLWHFGAKEAKIIVSITTRYEKPINIWNL